MCSRLPTERATPGVPTAGLRVSGAVLQRGERMRSTHPHRESALRLGWIFLRIGATAFGGLGTTLALIERELVMKRGLLTPGEVTEALTYTKLLPGSTRPKATTSPGYRL
jgi:chromate transport protein ChrA